MCEKTDTIRELANKTGEQEREIESLKRKIAAINGARIAQANYISSLLLKNEAVVAATIVACEVLRMETGKIGPKPMRLSKKHEAMLKRWQN